MIFAGSSDLQAGFHTASTWDGLGVKGSDIPATGPNGAAFAYPSLDLPADNDVEIRGLITSGPTVTSGPGSIVSFRTFDDTSFMLEVTDNAVVEWTWSLFADGVLVQAGLTSSITVGGETAVLTLSSSETRTVSSILPIASLGDMAVLQSETRNECQTITITSAGAQGLTLIASETRLESSALPGLDLSLVFDLVVSETRTENQALSLDQYANQIVNPVQSETRIESTALAIDLTGAAGLTLATTQTRHESSLLNVSALMIPQPINTQTRIESSTIFISMGAMEIPDPDQLTLKVTSGDYFFSVTNGNTLN